MKTILGAAMGLALSAGAAQAAVFDISATFGAPLDGVTNFTGTISWDDSVATYTPQTLFDGHDYSPVDMVLSTNIGTVTGTGFARIEDFDGTNFFPQDEIEITINSFSVVNWIGVILRLSTAPGTQDVITDHTDEHLHAIDPSSWTLQQLVVVGANFADPEIQTATVEYEYTGEVPLPGAAPLALIGLAALGVAGRRRRG